jgi:dihydrofolate reductase
MKIAIIVAIDESNGIGKNNKLLCHLPADLKRFKQLTNGFTVLMGQKTFESLPNGALPNRKNIVLSDDINYQAKDCIIIHSLDEALKICTNEEKVFIIGGGQVYKAFMQHADILHITKIHHVFDADTFFPEIKEEDWQEVMRTEMQADDKNKYNFSFIDYLKKL